MAGAGKKHVGAGGSHGKGDDSGGMAKMNGAAFDKMFAEHMVMDHKKDIGEYEKAAKAKDAAGQYAGNALPTLKKHLETAQSIQKSGAR